MGAGATDLSASGSVERWHAHVGVRGKAMHGEGNAVLVVVALVHLSWSFSMENDAGYVRSPQINTACFRVSSGIRINRST